MEHATVAPPWAQAAEHAIAAGQWHGAWCALLDAALPAALAAQQAVLARLDAWDALPAQAAAAQRASLLRATLTALDAAHAASAASPARSAATTARFEFNADEDPRSSAALPDFRQMPAASAVTFGRAS